MVSWTHNFFGSSQSRDTPRFCKGLPYFIQVTLSSAMFAGAIYPGIDCFQRSTTSLEAVNPGINSTGKHRRAQSDLDKIRKPLAELFAGAIYPGIDCFQRSCVSKIPCSRCQWGSCRILIGRILVGHCLVNCCQSIHRLTTESYRVYSNAAGRMVQDTMQ
jgi:hypothetical protein